VTYLLLEYSLVADYLDRRGEFRDEHLGLARAAHESGDLLLAGALAEPADRAVLLWRVDSPDGAKVVEAFVQADPYVTHGLVTSWSVRPWTVVVGGD
jgi:uncharacterized protein YciI